MATKTAGSPLGAREARHRGWRGPGSQWLRRAYTIVHAKPLGALGGLLILLLVGMALFAPLLAPTIPFTSKLRTAYAPQPGVSAGYR